LKRFKPIAIGASVLVIGTALVAMRPGSVAERDRTDPAIARISAVTPAARHDVDYELLDARLQKLMQRPTMVGLAVGVVENGRITFLKGYGETLAKSGEPVTPETVFRWASLSKGVAGTMVAVLAEKGRVDLDAPIARYQTTLRLPNQSERRATVSHLLSHRLGIYRNAYDEKLEEGIDPRAIRREIGSLSLVCQPGTCWNYENVAYDASAEIVQQVTGKAFDHAVRQRLFDPLGMTSANMTRDGLMSARSWARPHSAGRREMEISDAYYRVPAAGGVNSNIKDLAVWMLAQMGEMPGVISPRVLNALHTPLVKTANERRRLHMPPDPLKEAWYGYGWRTYDYGGHRIVGHRGGVDGYRSLILFDPEKKSGVVALWNSNTNQPGGLEFEVMDMILHRPFRDWLKIDSLGAPTPIASDDESSDVGDGSR
jgi:beta-lactamase class C